MQTLSRFVSAVVSAVRLVGFAAALFVAASVSAGTDITTLTVYNDSGQARSNVPVTFGQVFDAGDVSSGASVEARLGDGTPVTVQVDKRAAHSDGSLKHAVITARIPVLAAGATQSLILANAPSDAPGTPVALSALLATSFDAVVRLNVGGVPYSVSARDLLGGQARSWLQGPLASEWIVRGPLRTAAGVAHAHLTATFAIRAYAGSPITRARVDVAVENGKTFVGSPGTISYDATLEIGGSAAYSRSGMAHHQHSRWHKVLWWGGDPGVSVAHQSAYLRASRAVPNYDAQLVMSSTVLNAALAEWNAAPSAPLQNGLVSKDMPATGGRPEIGPLPRWDARHIISQDPRARPAVLGSGDLSGSWPIHYRDEGTNLPVSIDSHPQLWTDELPGSLGERDTTAGYTPDWSHQPALGYYPYLITGEYYYLEELQFWANWNLISRSPSAGNRNGSQGWLDADQVRALGWNLRTLALAAWITPDSDPLKGYFQDKLDNNFDHLIQRYITNNEAPLGFVTPNYMPVNETSAWMDDFVTQAIGWAHDFGYAKATTLMRSWKGRYVVDRLGDGGANTGCWAMSAPYRSVWAKAPNETALTNAREAYVSTAVLRFGATTGNAIANASCGSAQQFALMGRAANEIWGEYPDDPESYVANMQAAIAAAVDSGVSGALAAWNRYAQNSNSLDFVTSPQFALEPRNLSGTPPPPVPTVNLTANPTSVQSGGSSTLSWSSTNATSCTASGAWSGTKATSGSQATGALTANRTYTLSCTGAGGSAQRAVTVTVQGGATPAPTLTFTANPTSVTSGGSTQLKWSTTNATSCTASGHSSWTGSRPLSSSGWTISSITSNRTFTLQCSGAGGSVQRSVTVTVQAGSTAPTLTFTANPTSVVLGGNTQLSWSTTHATSCTASGDSAWTGSRPLASSGWVIGGIASTRTFTLQCTGAGGSVQRSVTVTVQVGTGTPTLTFSANPTSVVSGGSTKLSWTTTNATSCTASGHSSWTGWRPLASSGWTIGSITSNRTFTLQCSGSAGSVTRSVTVSVSAGGGGGTASIFGSVDSSYVDRFAVNKVYVFNGAVTPDDIDGDAVEPIVTVPVTQDANACTFGYGYAGSGLAAGTYTIAFTNDAGADVPGQNNTLAFIGTRQLTLSGSGVTSSFRPANILTVGAGKQFATLRAAQLAATAGAVIEVDAGTYTDDVTVWRQNNVTLRGVGGRAHIRGNRRIPYVSGDDRNNGMGLMVIKGSGISVENFEFSGAMVDDLNGAGIRNQGSNLSVCNGYFHDNEDGFLGGAYGTLLVEYSEFANNGFGDFGHNHNVYVDAGERLIFRHNYSHHAQVGHTLKTNARENHILYNRIMDEVTGNASYTIDVPMGGLTFVIGNLLQQGPNTENSALMSYGLEGLASGATHQLYLVNNSFVNDRGSGAFLQYQSGTALVRTINNLFVGGGTVPSGGVVQATTNLTTNAPGFVNEGTYDYRLTATSPARDAGTAPGSAGGVTLTPSYQYVHKAQRAKRPADARIDIGAYEFQ